MTETRRRLPAARIATKRIVAAADEGKRVPKFENDRGNRGSTLPPVPRRTMNDVHNASCAVAATAELIGSKWTPVIVHDLSEGPRRFTQLEHACPGISPRTLSERLQMLEHEGIVIRRSYAESPPRVEYELTGKGDALLPIIAEMRRFGHAHLTD